MMYKLSNIKAKDCLLKCIYFESVLFLLVLCFLYLLVRILNLVRNHHHDIGRLSWLFARQGVRTC